MKTNMNRFPVRLSVAAVHSAMVAMAMVSAAQAQDATVEELTQPRSTVEIGAMYVNPTNNENRNNVVPNSNGSNTSYKFGEYNGLQKQGTTAILNFDLRGGGSYDSEDATRYHITGTDLIRHSDGRIYVLEDNPRVPSPLPYRWPWCPP